MFSAVVAVAMLCAVVIFNEARLASASAPSGLPATVIFVGSSTVSTTAIVLNATTTNCAARIVSTGSNPVMLGFTGANGTTTNATTGLWQAGSTTVAYDSGLYGCGLLTAYSALGSIVNVVVTH